MKKLRALVAALTVAAGLVAGGPVASPAAAVTYPWYYMQATLGSYGYFFSETRSIVICSSYQAGTNWHARVDVKYTDGTVQAYSDVPPLCSSYEAAPLKRVAQIRICEIGVLYNKCEPWINVVDPLAPPWT